MAEYRIIVHDLSKAYRVPHRAPGLVASLKGTVRRTYCTVQAVRNVSFTVRAGEMVGLIGPNGAGKTTTLKILSGLLYPTTGEASVLGFVPWKRQADYLRRISMVLGNKSQMLWDIPPLDTFRVLGEIYHIPPTDLNRILDKLIALLDMENLLTRPVRDLSLGERMKCELVAGLLHRPEVLFLDEPTLGLDVSMQGRLRHFLAEYNRLNGVTVILTSHYMADVVALCPRVILIQDGRLLYDGELSNLAKQLAPFKLIRIALPQPDWQFDLPAGAELIERENGHLTLRVARSEAPSITAHLLNALPVADLAVEDPPIEAVIDKRVEQAASIREEAHEQAK